MNVAIYIYENAEVLDFSGPFEVFSTANRFINSANKFQVFLIAEKKQAVMARGAYSVNPHYGFNHHPPIDLLIVVGGVHSEELNKAHVIDWVKSVAQQSHTVASVCTGAFILAESGLLSGLQVTTHWEDIPELRKSYPSLEVVEDRPWVDQGKFVTSGGISAGIDMSLYLISKIINQELAEKTAKQMEYHWRQN